MNTCQMFYRNVYNRNLVERTFFAVIRGKIVVETQYYVEFMFHEVLTVVWLEINDGVGIIVFV